MVLAILVAIMVIGLLMALAMVLRHKGDLELKMNVRKGELSVRKKR
jgi:hypothetical protein